MPMKVHHLNCGTINSLFGHLVCHVLLLETANSLVLVDAGIGLCDAADPKRRLGLVRHVFRPTFDPAQTAVEQVKRLGFGCEDVRHIIATHCDWDHIGGVADFPHATVHVTTAEAAAFAVPGLRERMRYRHAQLAHAPNIVRHGPSGEPWHGFAAAKELNDVAPGIVLIPTPGHSRGHACVAVDAGHRWVLHSGDAFYHRHVINGRKPPIGLAMLEVLDARNLRQVRENQARLLELSQQAHNDLLIVSAHDAQLLLHAQKTANPAA